MLPSILILWILILLSASCSSLETALFALSPVEKNRLKTGGGVSARISKVLEKPRELLTTVLFGNELLNVGIAIVAGGLFYDFLEGYDPRLVYLLSISVTTFFLLVFGEIVPKNIAIRNRLTVSQFLILPYQFFAWSVFPFRWILTKLADRLVGLFGSAPERRLIMEEEFQTLLDLSREQGTLEEFERTLIQNTISFSGTMISKVMTPRQEIVAVPQNFSVKEILEVLKKHPFSRLPVYRENLDHVVGVLHAKELLQLRLSHRGEAALPSVLKPHVEIQPDQSLSEVFEIFKREGVHIGLVRGMDGNLLGLVTMTDLLGRLFP